jgi:hypothetical protein
MEISMRNAPSIQQLRAELVENGFIFDLYHSNWNNCLSDLQIVGKKVKASDARKQFPHFSLENVWYTVCSNLTVAQLQKYHKHLLYFALYLRHLSNQPVKDLRTVRISDGWNIKYFADIKSFIIFNKKLFPKLKRFLTEQGLEETFSGWRSLDTQFPVSNAMKESIFQDLVQFILQNFDLFFTIGQETQLPASQELPEESHLHHRYILSIEHHWIETSDSVMTLDLRNWQLQDTTMISTKIRNVSKKCYYAPTFAICSFSNKRYDSCFMVNPYASKWHRISMRRLENQLSRLHDIIYTMEKRILLKRKSHITFEESIQSLKDLAKFINSKPLYNDF